MSDQEGFGLRLRATRERRGVTLEQLASHTNVPVALWEGMERNDFSRWPTGMIARSYVREYASMVGLDPHETVEELCRLFPVADRRVRRVMNEKAALVGIPSTYRDDCLPPEGDRRAEPSAPPDRRRAALAAVRTQRAFAAAADAVIVTALSAALSRVLVAQFPHLLGVVTLAYWSAGTVFLGRSPGVAAAAVLGRRLPEMQHARERRVEL